ncbi:MAG TPA: biotin/lipoyl-binding protein, partial [Sphingobium sp.]
MADATPEFTSETGAAGRTSRMEQRKKWLIRLALVVLAAGLIYLLWYVLVGRNHVGTDNAYVNAEIAQVTPLISAQAVEVRVTDTQQVKRGDILVRLDPTNARIALAQA